MEQGKITRIAKTKNQITIECTGFFTDLESKIQKYEQNYSKNDIKVILSDYENQVVSLQTLEKLREQIKQLTRDVSPKEGPLTQFVKTALSIRKNIRYTNREEAELIDGLIKGKCNSKGFASIMKAALELQGIESNIIKNEKGQNCNQIKLRGKWYQFDSVASKKSLAQNIGKYIQREKKENHRETTKNAEENKKKQINRLAREVKKTVPSMPKEKTTIFEKIATLFGQKKEEPLALPQPAVSPKAQNMQIMEYSPAGMIGDKILWEMRTWEKADVKGKVNTSYVLLPTIGTPQQIYDRDPEAFTQLYQELLKTVGNGQMPFLGSIQVEEDNAWSAFSNETKEMQKIQNQVAGFIQSKVQANQVVAEFEKQYQRLKQKEAQVQPKENQAVEPPKIVKQPAQQPKKPTPQNNIPPKTEPQTIVIGDLHSNVQRWNIVRTKLQQDPSLKVIILGDAMDRGEYGVEILLQIKELSDKGRVQYIPGNHDEFAYNCIKAELDGFTQSGLYNRAKWELLNNKGTRTYEKLTNFSQTVNNALQNGYIQKNINIHQFMDWLGNQPVQVTAHQGECDYALAHAFFDAQLYQYDKNFNLNKAFELQKNGHTTQNNQVLQKFKNTLWYRAEKDQNENGPISWPQRYAMVVGHTSQKEGVNVKLLHQDFMKPMVYVDCGKYKSLGAFNLNGKNIDDLEKWDSKKEKAVEKGEAR